MRLERRQQAGERRRRDPAGVEAGGAGLRRESAGRARRPSAPEVARRGDRERAPGRGRRGRRSASGAAQPLLRRDRVEVEPAASPGRDGAGRLGAVHEHGHARVLPDADEVEAAAGRPEDVRGRDQPCARRLDGRDERLLGRLRRRRRARRSRAPAPCSPKCSWSVVTTSSSGPRPSPARTMLAAARGRVGERDELRLDREQAREAAPGLLAQARARPRSTPCRSRPSRRSRSSRCATASVVERASGPFVPAFRYAYRSQHGQLRPRLLEPQSGPFAPDHRLDRCVIGEEPPADAPSLVRPGLRRVRREPADEHLVDAPAPARRSPPRRGRAASASAPAGRSRRRRAEAPRPAAPGSRGRPPRGAAPRPRSARRRRSWSCGGSRRAPSPPPVRAAPPGRPGAPSPTRAGRRGRARAGGPARAGTRPG